MSHQLALGPPMIHFEGVPGHPPQITPVAWVLPLVLNGHPNIVVWGGGVAGGVTFGIVLDEVFPRVVEFILQN